MVNDSRWEALLLSRESFLMQRAGSSEQENKEGCGKRALVQLLEQSIPRAGEKDGSTSGCPEDDSGRGAKKNGRASKVAARSGGARCEDCRGCAARKGIYRVDPITVPFAPISYKVVCGIPLLIFAVLAFYWGSKNLAVCVWMLLGKLPLPAKSSPPFVVLGLVFWLVPLGSRCNSVPGSARDHAADRGVRGRNPRGSRAAALPRQIYSVERDYPGNVLDAGTGESDSKPAIVRTKCAGGSWQCGSDAGQCSGNGETKDTERNDAAMQTCFAESSVVLLRGLSWRVCSADLCAGRDGARV